MATDTDTYTCDKCSKHIQPEPGSIATGYGLDNEGRKICYECCADIDRETMLKGLPI